MKKKSIYIAILIVIFSVFLFYLIFIPKIKLDNKEITINYNDKYVEGKVSAKNLFKDYSKKIKVEGKVNTNKIGKYKIKYSINYGFIKMEKTKIINVVDKKSPVITLNGNNEVVVCPNCEYNEEGYSATDEYDGDLTSKVKKE